MEISNSGIARRGLRDSDGSCEMKTVKPQSWDTCWQSEHEGVLCFKSRLKSICLLSRPLPIWGQVTRPLIVERFRMVFMLVNLDTEVNCRSGSLQCPRILPTRALGLSESAGSDVSSMRTGECFAESWVKAKSISHDASMPMFLDDKSPEHKTVCQQGRKSRSNKMLPQRSGR